MDAHRIGDVDMHEEGQLQNLDDEQQHQQDENEHAAEQEDDDEDAEAERDAAMYEEMVMSRQQHFDSCCNMIEQNRPDFYSFGDVIYVDDHEAIQLGRALLGNTELQDLSVKFMGTSRGARVLAGGISGSQITSLTLMESEELPLELSQLYVRSLLKIVLQFPICDEFADQLFECLTVSKQLRHLTIDVDQFMAPHVAQVLSNFLQRSPIMSLECMGTTNDISTLLMQTLYAEGMQHCQNLRCLHLQGLLGDMHALVTMLPKLYELSIVNVFLNLAMVELLTRGLSHANRLAILTLSECYLNDQHMNVLSPILGTHSTITSVRLDRNQIGDEGVTSFVKNWRPQSKIEGLTLSGNIISFKGAHLLMNAVSNRSTQFLLNLRENSFIGFNGLTIIGKVLPIIKIQVLELCCTVKWIEHKDVLCDEAIIQKTKLMEASKSLLEGVRGNGHLLQMGLYDLHLPTSVIQEIGLYITANARGRQKVLENQHKLPCSTWCHFLAKEGMTSSLMFLFVRELPVLMMSGISHDNTNERK